MDPLLVLTVALLLAGHISGKPAATETDSTTAPKVTNLFHDDRVVLSLESDTFYKTVTKSDKTVLVLFYLSWCGHCINYAPHYVNVSQQLSVWRDTLTVSAINCASNLNSAICRDHAVLSYPTLQIVPPKTPQSINHTVAIDAQMLAYVDKTIYYVIKKHKTWFPNASPRSDIIHSIDSPTLLPVQTIDRNSDSVSDELYYEDLIYALTYSLKTEVSSHRIISSNKMAALKDYVQTLSQYFVTGDHSIRKSLLLLNAQLVSHSSPSLSSQQWTDMLEESSFLSATSGKGDLIHCRGSATKYRGYPCTLWSLFHTLSVQASVGDVSGQAYKVLTVMRSYISEFFGCTECSKNFIQEAKSGYLDDLDASDSSAAVMWLWITHNKVNKRLAGDGTEDPAHPKIQYPSSKACPACKNPKGLYNQEEVLKYLKAKYTNIKRKATASLPTVRHSHEDATPKSNMFLRGVPERVGPRGMNIADLAMCYAVYIISAFIIALLFYYIVIKQRLYLKLRMRGSNLPPPKKSLSELQSLNQPIY